MELRDIIKQPKTDREKIQEGLNLAQCIDYFTALMIEKIARNIGIRSGWDEEKNIDAMREEMSKAWEEDDLVSIANYSMFIYMLVRNQEVRKS